MNIQKIKSKIKYLKGKRVLLKVNAGRNKFEQYEGVIHETYPSLFTVKTINELKSFTYVDVLIDNVAIKALE